MGSLQSVPMTIMLELLLLFLAYFYQPDLGCVIEIEIAPAVEVTVDGYTHSM